MSGYMLRERQKGVNECKWRNEEMRDRLFKRQSKEIDPGTL
jgi:hypothetical protein